MIHEKVEGAEDEAVEVGTKRSASEAADSSHQQPSKAVKATKAAGVSGKPSPSTILNPSNLTPSGFATARIKIESVSKEGSEVITSSG